MFTRKKIQKEFDVIIHSETVKQLSSTSFSTINEYLEQDEWGLCFDQILYEIYEQNLPIDSNFYTQIITLADLMHIPSAEYDFIKERMTSS